MGGFDGLLYGFQVALAPINLMWAMLGVTVGTIIGVLPGIGPVTGIAILLPLTFGREPTGALIMLAGIYYGAMYGGSTTSILANIPGESASVMTAVEGYEMAKKGRGGAALGMSAFGSFIAGTVGFLLLGLLAPMLAKMALKFGPPEYFALMLLSFTLVAALSTNNILKGMMMLGLGLCISMIGIDQITGEARFTFGNLTLLDGIDFVIVAIGLFAVLRGPDQPGVADPAHHAAQTFPLCRALAHPEGLARELGAHPAGHGAGVRHRLPAGRRRHDLVVHLLRRGKGHFQGTGEIRHRAHAGGRRRGVLQQRLRRRRVRPPADAGHPQRRFHRHAPGRIHDAGGGPGPLAVHPPPRCRLGHHRQHVHRQSSCSWC